jgi:hypothetical protein
MLSILAGSFDWNVLENFCQGFFDVWWQGTHIWLMYLAYSRLLGDSVSW